MTAIPTLILFLLTSSLAWTVSNDPYSSPREKMIQAIEADVQETVAYIGRNRLNPKVLEVMGTVPRHEFVPEALREWAYENRPLPIGYGQTISQPYIVALMTDLLELGPSDKVLELGTGSGYQAAVLSPLVKQVYTIEIIPQLSESAKERLKNLGFKNVTTRGGDGYYGWKEHAPFDRIVVTAAANHIPPALLRQLKPGGKMVIPIGSPFSTQQLMVIEKDSLGNYKTRQILPVMFVPLRRGS